MGRCRAIAPHAADFAAKLSNCNNEIRSKTHYKFSFLQRHSMVGMEFGQQIFLKQLLTRNNELVKTVNVFMLAS